LLAVEDERRRWPVLAGAAIGAACVVTPTCGGLAALTGLTVFLSRRNRRGLLAYMLSGAIVPAGMVLYLASRHALIPAFDDVILFTANQYASIQGVRYGSWASQQNGPLAYAFPAAAALALVLFVRDRKAQSRGLFWPCAAFAVAGFVASFPRPDVSHIGFEIPLVAPLLAGCASQLARSWTPAIRYASSGALAVLLMPAVVAFSWLFHFMATGEPVPAPRGAAIFFDLPGAPKMVARIAALPPGDGMFFYPFMPMMPFLTGREHVSKYDLLTPGYSLPEQYHEACLSAVRHAAWVVIDRNWTDPATLKHVYPAMRDPRPAETRALEQALDDGFDFVARDGTFELRHRRDDAGEMLCDDEGGVRGASR